MKKVMIMLISLLFLSCTKKQEYTYDDLLISIQQNDINKLMLIYENIQNLTDKQQEDLVFLSLDQFHNFEMANVFYDKNMDINHYFSRIEDNMKIQVNYLYFALTYGDANDVNYAIQKHCSLTDLCYVSSAKKETPLSIALRSKDSEKCKLVIENIDDYTQIDILEVLTDLFYFGTEVELNSFFVKPGALDYLYSNDQFPLFIACHYDEPKLKFIQNQIQNVKLTFSNNVNYYEGALGGKNKVKAIDWLLKNIISPNEKFTYSYISDDTKITAADAAYEYAHARRLVYYDENGTFDESGYKNDIIYLEYLELYDYLRKQM